MARSYGSNNLEPGSTMLENFTMVRVNTERLGQHHIDFSAKVLSEITTRIETVRDLQSKEQRKAVAEGQQAVKDLDAARAASTKARDRYYYSNQAVEKTQLSIKEMTDGRKELDKKSMDKLNGKLLGQLKERDSYNAAFKKSVDKLHETRQSYDARMSAVLQTLQNHAHVRLVALREACLTFADLQETNLNVQVASASENHSHARNIDPIHDVNRVVLAHKTGATPLPERQYKPYYSKVVPEADSPLGRASSASMPDEDSEEEDESLPEVDAFASLRNVLANADTSAGLMQFMEKEFCQESLLYYQAVERFRELQASPEQLLAEADSIYRKYLEVGSEFEVNVESAVRKRWEDTRDQSEFEDAPDASIFDESQAIVFKLIQDNAFRRYTKSDLAKPIRKKLRRLEKAEQEKLEKQQVEEGKKAEEAKEEADGGKAESEERDAAAAALPEGRTTPSPSLPLDEDEVARAAAEAVEIMEKRSMGAGAPDGAEADERDDPEFFEKVVRPRLDTFNEW